MDRILENIAKGLKETSIESPEEGASQSSNGGAPARRKKREDTCSISEDAVYHHEVDDAHMLEINKRLNRVVMILKVLYPDFDKIVNEREKIVFTSSCLSQGLIPGPFSWSLLPCHLSHHTLPISQNIF